MNFIENPDVLNIYHYGSYVYKTFDESTSDYDFLVIVSDTYPQSTKNVMPQNDEPIDVDEVIFDKTYKNCQIKIITLSNWKDMVERNTVEALEVFWLDDEFVIKERAPLNYKLNYDFIRENVSKTASNSFVKCKKKLELTTDYRIGKKSLWHSLRLLMFGNQIMKYGKITNYSEANIYYDDIVKNENNDWSYYKEKYQKIYNSLKSQFKINHELAKNKSS